MRFASPAFAVVGAMCAAGASSTRLLSSGRAERMIAENLRAWLIGTHHGVTAKWLPFYLAEFASRAWRDPTVVLTRVVSQISRAL